jgi:hypothetical protein
MLSLILIHQQLTAFNFISLIDLETIKRDRDRSRKHSVQINLISSNDASQFTASRQKKIFDLLKREVFRIIDLGDISIKARVFNSRFVNEVKHSGTDKAFEKSRLIVQTYNNKSTVATRQQNQRFEICQTQS